MPGPDIDDYLKQGMYGQKETKPDERRKFLGTLRERVIIALTQAQMREGGIYVEVEEELKKNPNAELLLNGNVDYSYLSKYTKLSDKYNVEYTIVTNKEYNSEVGLVLTLDYAIDKDEVFITKKQPEQEQKPTNNKKGFFSIFESIFKK